MSEAGKQHRCPSPSGRDPLILMDFSRGEKGEEEEGKKEKKEERGRRARLIHQ